MADVRKNVEIALKVVGVNKAQIKTVSTSFTKVSTSVNKATASINRFKKAVESIKAPASLNKITTSLNKFTSLDTSGAVSKIRKLNTALKSLEKRKGTKAFGTLSSDVSKIKSSFSQATSSVKKVQSSLQGMNGTLQTSGVKLRTFGDKFKTVLDFRAISEIILQVTDAFRAGVVSIFDYDQALKDLQAITGATGFEVEQMGRKILEVASSTKFSAAEVAEGMRIIGQAGFTATEAVETMQAVSDLATGTLTSMSSTVDLVTTSMRVFGIEANRSSEIADVFASSVNSSKLTVDKLRTAMNYIGPIANSVGVSFKELSASMSTLANSGLRASKIGTGLRRVLADLADPSSKLKKAASEAGVALQEIDPTANSLSSVLSNLNLVIEDAGQAFDLFGKRGAAAVLTLARSGTTFNTMMQSVSRTGIAAKQAAKQMEGLGVSFKNLKDKLGVLAIAVGELGITDAFRVLIELGKQLADIFIFLVGNPITGFIIKITAIPALLYGIAKAMAIMKASMSAFTVAVPQVAAFSTALKGASASAAGLNIALGPVLVVLTALTLAVSHFYDAFKNGSKDASNAATEAAQEFESLSDKITNYNISAIKMKEGSLELKTEALRLREELIKVANSTSELANEAAEAAGKISPLTGEIEDQGKALDEFQDKVNNLSFKKVEESFELAGKTLDAQTSFLVRKINFYYDSLKNVSQALIGNFDFTKELSEDRDRAEELSKALKNGSAGFKELIEWKQRYGDTDVSTQGKELAKDIELINEKANNFIEETMKINNISLDDTEEGFRQIGKNLGQSGIKLDAFVYKMQQLSKASESSFENVIEKWSKNEDPKFLTNVVDEYNNIEGLLEKIDKQEVANFERRQNEFTTKLKTLRDEYNAEVKKNGESEALVKSFLDKERVLILGANKLKEEMARSESAQKAKLYANELRDLKESLKINNETYKDSLFKREEERRKIIEASNARIQKMIAGTTIDTKNEKKVYQELLETKEVMLAEHLMNIEQQEREGTINSIQSEARKKEATVQHYADMLVEAEKYYDKVKDIDDPKEVAKAKKVLLNAEEKYYKEREKLLTYDNKLVKRREDQADKILKVEEDLAEKIEKINKDLVKKLKKIEEEREDNKKETQSALLSLEGDTQDEIDAIRSRDYTDEQKDALASQRAAEKLSEAKKLLAQAEKEDDLEKLELGKDLLDQSSSLSSGLDDQASAITGVKAAAEQMKKALSLEGELKDLELLAEKNKEVAEAEKKRAEAKEAAKLKKESLEKEFQDAIVNIGKIQKASVTAANELYKERSRLEEIRHLKEMKNIEAELSKLKEKRITAQSSYESTAGSNEIDNTARSEANLRIANEQKIHDQKIANYDAQIAKLKEKAQIELQLHENIQSKNKAAISEDVKQIEEVSEKGFRVIEEDGVKVYTNLTDSQRAMFEETAEAALEAGKKTAKETTDATAKAFNEIEELHQGLNQTVKEGVEIPVKVKDDDGLLDTMFGPKEQKIETVEIPVKVKDEDGIIDTMFGPQEQETQDYNVNVKPQDPSVFDQLQQFMTELKSPIETVIQISGLDAAFNGVKKLVDKIAELKDKTITITQKTVTTGGDTTYAATGTVLSGYGGGDRNPALLEDGEAIIRKEAVKMLGPAFFNSLNNLRIPKFNLGGVMGQGFSTTQSTNGVLSDFGKVTLSTGNMEVPALLHKDTLSEVTDKLSKLKRFAT